MKHEHQFNLKQRDMLVKLLVQAKAQAQSDFENESSRNGSVETKVALSLAEDHGAMPIVAKLRELRKEVEDAEKSLSDLGFQCDDESISIRWGAPRSIVSAVEAAKRAARDEVKKVLKKYDLAVLDVWASESVSQAKAIVEQLL